MKYSLTKHYKYKLEENEVKWICVFDRPFHTKYMELKDNGQFFIWEGYTWDGSSVPHKKLIRVLSLWQYDADKYCKKASLIHDALCQAMREGLMSKLHKAYADRLYRDMCIAGGMSVKNAERRYRILRKFGDVGINPEKNPRNRIYEV